MVELDSESFQGIVSEYLVRHRSILDVLSKFQECSAKVNRSVVKAVTSCGCVKISAERQTFPEDASLLSLKEYMNTHLSGEVCPNCREFIETEMGQAMFYLAAICSLLDLNLNEIIEQESKRVNTLGVFNLT